MIIFCVGAKAVGRNCGSIFWPAFPFLLHVVIFAWFTFLSLYIGSSGTKKYTVVNVDKENCTNTCPPNPLTNNPYKVGKSVFIISQFFSQMLSLSEPSPLLPPSYY